MPNVSLLLSSARPSSDCALQSWDPGRAPSPSGSPRSWEERASFSAQGCPPARTQALPGAAAGTVPEDGRELGLQGTRCPALPSGFPGGFL